MPPKSALTPLERIVARCRLTERGCWEWQGTKSVGYGKLTLRDAARRIRLTHVIAYEATIGPVPPGLQLDHLCRNRACCNPMHLEPVTPSENVRRGTNPKHSSRTHCARGHEFTAANTSMHYGIRRCKACVALRQTSGKCLGCPAPARPGKSCCAVCAAERAATERTRREARALHFQIKPATTPKDEAAE